MAIELSGAKSLHAKYHDVLKSVSEEIESQAQDWIQLFPDDSEGPGVERLKVYGGWLAAHKLAKLILTSLDKYLSTQAKREEDLLDIRRKFQAIETQFSTQLPLVAKKLNTWIYNTTTKRNLLTWTKSWVQNTPYLDAQFAFIPQESVLQITDYEMRVVFDTYTNGEMRRIPLVRLSTIQVPDPGLAKICDCRTGKHYEILTDGSRKDADDEKGA